MKPFNLEEAKLGKPVVTRDGKKVRILCFDAKNKMYPIIASFFDEDGEEVPISFTNEGNFVEHEESEDDIFMFEEEKIKKKGWIVIRNKKEEIQNGALGYYCSMVFSNKSDAEKIYTSGVHKLIEIEIEE